MESATPPHLHDKKQKMSAGAAVVIIGDDDQRKMSTPRKPPAAKVCQADRCSVDLSYAKTYHRRHKVCEPHSKAPAVVVAGILQRFCQQCSRFHELSEFDESKRSCRRRLAGHNERRRKNPVDNSAAEGGGGRRKGGVGSGGQGEEEEEDPMRVEENGDYNKFHVRL